MIYKTDFFENNSNFSKTYTTQDHCIGLILSDIKAGLPASVAEETNDN